jgi:hypothetical protein
MAVGKPAPPRPRKPAERTSLSNDPTRDKGRLPCRARWSASVVAAGLVRSRCRPELIIFEASGGTVSIVGTSIFAGSTGIAGSTGQEPPDTTVGAAADDDRGEEGASRAEPDDEPLDVAGFEAGALEEEDDPDEVCEEGPLVALEAVPAPA